MLDQMRKTINRNLLKYSAGHHVFCPHCNNVADYRSWVIAESPTKANMWNGCSSCFEPIRHECIDKGWDIIEESKKQKRQPKFDEIIDITTSKGEKIEIPCVKAFSMYGHTFFAHLMVNNPKEWAISHGLTGAAVVLYRKSKAAAIRDAKQKLADTGEDGFKLALSIIAP